RRHGARAIDPAGRLEGESKKGDGPGAPLPLVLPDQPSGRSGGGHPVRMARYRPSDYSAASATASTETYLRPSLPSWKRTRPAPRANRVWSLPMPTFTPGYTRVPRWRMMMLPPMTCWPPNFFTPRRFDSESRPLRDEPPAFLCAISNYSEILFSGRGGRGFRLGGLLGGLLFLATNGEDAQQGHLLAMAVATAIVVPATLLEDDHLLALGLSDDFGRDHDARGVLDLPGVTRQQDIAQRDLVTGLTSQLLDRDLVSGGNPVLLAARAHDCEHGNRFQSKLASTAPPCPVDRMAEGMVATRRLPAKIGRA